MFSPWFWEAVGVGCWEKEEGRKGRQKCPLYPSPSISFFISLSVFVTEFLINRKRLPKGLKQVQGDWTPGTGNSG